MIKESGREEICVRIDQIFSRALSVTSDQQETDPQELYSDIRLQKLVIDPIQSLCFEGVDPETKNLFYSNDGALGRCTKLLKKNEKAYMCKDCARDISSSLCEECFTGSNHVQHRYVPADVKYKLYCDCGDSGRYRNSPPCVRHSVPMNSRSLPESFVKRIKSIIKCLFKYLELLFGDESLLDAQIEDWLLMGGNLDKLSLKDKPRGFIHRVDMGITKNVNVSCLLIFRPEDESPEFANACVSFASPVGKLADLLSIFESCGYLCVRFRDKDEGCHAWSAKIQKFIRDRFPGSRVHCRVINDYKLFFMKLACNIVRFISETCLRKSELCDLLSEMVFNETLFPEKFFFNQSLWKEIRYEITYRIFLPTLFSQKGGLNLVKFYLKNFDRLYSELLNKNDMKKYVFRLILQLSTSKPQFFYLIENSVLCKILDFVSCYLNKLGFGRGKAISNVLKNIGPKGIDPVFDVATHFCEILYFPLDSIEPSVQFKSELQKAAIRLVQFCVDFDDMEPLTLKNTNQGDGINSDDVLALVLQLHNIFVPYAILLLKYDEIANMIIKEFVEMFKKDMKTFTANLSTQQAVEKLLTDPDIEKKPFSIFNLSQRLFFDLFTECVIKRKLNNELKKTIFEDQVLLLWVSQAAITSLSFEMYFKAGLLISPSIYLRSLISMYRYPVMVHYLFMQDFNALQILISRLSPDHFLKLLLFNICPSIRQKTSMNQTLSSILSLPQFEDGLVLQQVLIMIYNALTEMRLVGDLEDPDSYFLERQLIHMLACDCKTRSYLRNLLYMDRTTYKTRNTYSNMTNFDVLLNHISCTMMTPQNEETQMIFPIYLNPGCPFYYLNTIEDTKITLETLYGYYKDRIRQFLSPITCRLRDEFRGLHDFIFSETFLDFIMECFVKWYQNPNLWLKDSPSLFLFILLCLHLILMMSKDFTVHDSYRERMYDFFGPHPKLKNRGLLDIIANELPNRQNPLEASMMDLIIKNSHIGQRSNTNCS